jgi:hydroxyethylthiazole kinase-like uncharacterized protein yjeF
MKVLKVVTAEEMARLEKGKDPNLYIATVGEKVAERAMQYMEKQGLGKEVTLLVGKGNNGADAYAAGICLINSGYKVQAFCAFEKTSPINEAWKEKFLSSKGRLSTKITGLVLDGFLGTGFIGRVEGKMLDAINEVNAKNLPVIAIDIPSGLNGSTGVAQNIAIMATLTITLGLPKLGLFLHDGPNHTGKVEVIDFGLPESVMASAVAACYLPLSFDLPKLKRTRHKYEAGYVVGLGGSKEMSGAVKLSTLAALRTGAGMVRLFSFEEIGSAAFEVISQRFDLKSWNEALKKAQAVFIGPGLGKGSKVQKFLKTHLKKIRNHCVIDADALLPNLPFPKGAILTPHRGEVLRLLGLKEILKEEDLFAKIIHFCNQEEVFVVLKGEPTFIFGPKHKPVILTGGDPGMATAGAGDVLTGMIAALLAQKCPLQEAAILGVALHKKAGELAAEKKTSYSMIASDLIDALPEAFKALSYKI